jgi:hypothetical protein
MSTPYSCIKQRERKTSNQAAPCTSHCGLAMQRKSCGSLRCRLHLSTEAIAETLVHCRVVRDLREQFRSSLLREPRSAHCVRRRASANTSSAAKVSTSPRSCAATRRSISSAQAASTSANAGSCKDSKRSSTKRDRSPGARFRACCASSATRSDMTDFQRCCDHMRENISPPCDTQSTDNGLANEAFLRPRCLQSSRT